jgi:hypothetical protein
MSINWRERIVAATIHFLATLLVAGLAAALIFFVWFPGALADMVGGRKLFWIVVACDLTLGPLISLVIYNSKKPRKELVLDYTIIAIVQLAALIYGTSIVAASRPAFVAFYGDRIEVVTALELDDADLQAGVAPEFRSKSWTGPRLVSVESPTDSKEKQDLLFASLAGKDGQLFPKYYREYDAARATIREKSQTLDVLLKDSGAARAQIESAIASTGKAQAELRWLLVHHRFGFATALVDAQSFEPLTYVNVDPVWLDQKASTPTQPQP